MDLLRNYLANLQTKLATGNSLEHTHRSSFESLIHKLNEEIIVLNEPKRSEHGNPDFVFLNKKNRDILLGYAETKDIDKNLNEVEKSEQLRRYLGYSNLILTNYTEFRFFRNGEKYQTIKIANLNQNKLQYNEDSFHLLEAELKAFLEGKPEKITNATRLAKIMGGRASRIRDNVNVYLNTNDNRNEELERVYEVMKKLLVHDLSVEKFADMYAQTLVYGLFVARFYDSTGDSFTRQEARDLVPPSNPFLQHFFDHIVGPKFDKRLAYIVDDLCEIFTVAPVSEIIKRHFNLFGENTEKDPIIHFYEDFLKEYDPELRKQMGAYYTPVPVVGFMIRAVDEIIKKDFGLSEGLASREKIEIEKMLQGKKVKEKIHRVQLLDPAVGTATFLNETISFIHKRFQNQQGMWESYANQDLLPRLHGFELMMAPYTIAHLKLAMTLKETGIKTITNRLGVYLTNTLDEADASDDSLFSYFGLAEAISDEAKTASRIKNEVPIMVVLGNPPYSVSSQNKGKWIHGKLTNYKKDLNERNIQPLSDDYIKFIRFAEDCIQKTGSGVVAMITNNSFIDGIIHRQMRKHLLETFDDIYILDLHGNSKKKETALDGSKDENVFNIMQGVSINIFVKKGGKKKGLGTIFHTELHGKRKDKFVKLREATLSTLPWKKLDYTSPYYFFVPKDFGLIKEYEKGFKVDELFRVGGSGIKFRKDNLLVKKHFTDDSVKQLLNDMHTLSNEQIRAKYNIEDTSDWKLEDKKKYFELGDYASITKVLYRPFDTRYTYYPLDKINNLIPRGDSRRGIMKNMFEPNLALITSKQQSTFDFQHILVTDKLVDMCTISSQTKEGGYSFPLYIFHENGTKTPNLNAEIANAITKAVGDYTPEQLFDYIYAMLHSLQYRSRYKEFLKIDFPRIPYPKNRVVFEQLASIGIKLRELHLLQAPIMDVSIYPFPESGSDIVEKVEYKEGKVYINPSQYFDEVPRSAWEFYIGGYQPAQKWLKDRKGRTLVYEELTHYQKVLTSIQKTIEIMKEIDSIIEL